MERLRRALRPQLLGILGIAVILISLLNACGGGYELAVEMDEALSAQAQGVDLFVIDSCETAAGLRGEDPPAALARLRIERSGEVSGLSSLPSGRYGLYGRAHDASCVAIAEGCVPVSLSRDATGTLLLRLSATEGLGCLRSAACAAACEGGPDGDAGIAP